MPTEKQREQNRKKSRRFRAKHAADIALARLGRPPATGRRGALPVWTATELVDAAGLPARLIVHRASEPVAVPSGLSVSRRWLPAWLLTFKAARAAGLWRLRQVEEWGGKCEWQCPTKREAERAPRPQRAGL